MRLLFVLLIFISFNLHSQNSTKYEIDIELKDLKKAFIKSDTIYYNMLHTYKVVNIYRKNRIIQSNINSSFISVHHNYYNTKKKRRWGSEVVFYSNKNQLFYEMPSILYSPFEKRYHFKYTNKNYRIKFSKNSKHLIIKKLYNCHLFEVSSTKDH